MPASAGSSQAVRLHVSKRQDWNADHLAASAKIHGRELPRLVRLRRVDHVVNRVGKFESRLAGHFIRQALGRGRFASIATQQNQDMRGAGVGLASIN